MLHTTCAQGTNASPRTHKERRSNHASEALDNPRYNRDYVPMLPGVVS